MNILCIDDTFPLSAAFRALGHTVALVKPRSASPRFEQCLAEADVTPDLIIQQECLGRHILIEGLDTAPCPTMYLAIDAHLNLFWQRCYARLFDAVLTPHVSLFANLPPEWRHPHCLPCPPLGYDRPWRPFAERSTDIAFCGRITEHRQVRKWMAELLGQKHGLVALQNLGFDDMLNRYADTRIVPNEAIAREVNFRLLEAASCGALVLSQDVGPDQDNVFTPGKEIRVCRDGVELVEEIAWFRQHQEQAEKMGHAAWRRVQHEHLPIHRASAIVGFANALTSKRAAGDDARFYYWLAKVQHARSHKQASLMARLLSESRSLAARPERTATQIRLLAESGQKEKAHALCQELLGSNTFTDSLDCNCAASACAMRLGDFSLARFFWLRHTANDTAHRRKTSPQTPVELYREWATTLRKAGRLSQPGFLFTCELGQLPEVAFEFLLLAYADDNNNPETLRHIDSLCAVLPAYAELRLGILARRCLQEPDNWRLQENYGKASLTVYRVDEGLFELASALGKKTGTAYTEKP